MLDLATAIMAVGLAHESAINRLSDECRSLQPKRSDGRLNEVGRAVVFQMLRAGLTNKDISTVLDISSPAVTHYRRQCAQGEALNQSRSRQVAPSQTAKPATSGQK
jgi:DNA-binding NarL/FixJ family response regulator